MNVSDTLPMVWWTLEMGCGLRQGEAVMSARAAAQAVAKAQMVAESLDRGDGTIVGDVLVTAGTSDFEKPAGVDTKQAAYPHWGFRPSAALGNVGGIDGLLRMCGGCPANASGSCAAGCVGYLVWEPASDLMEMWLREAVGRLGLSEVELFRRTTPMWYGLWMESPLTGENAGHLRRVLEKVTQNVARLPEKERRNSRRKEMERLVGALGAAEAKGLRLHVWMAAPGHGCMGSYADYPHCPRCKARTPEKIKKVGLGKETRCAVCGAMHVPREGKRIHEESLYLTTPTLREMAGREALAVVAQAWLERQGGLSAEDAARVVEATESWQQEKNARHAERPWLAWGEGDGLGDLRQFVRGKPSMEEICRRCAGVLGDDATWDISEVRFAPTDRTRKSFVAFFGDEQPVVWRKGVIRHAGGELVIRDDKKGQVKVACPEEEVRHKAVRVLAEMGGIDPFAAHMRRQNRRGLLWLTAWLVAWAGAGIAAGVKWGWCAGAAAGMAVAVGFPIFVLWQTRVRSESGWEQERQVLYGEEREG